MTVVDAHVHVFAAASRQFPRDVHELTPPEREAPVEQFVADMEGAGIDRAVLVALSHHDEYLVHSLARHPGLFAAIGAGTCDAADYRQRRAVAGLQGVRLTRLGNAGELDPKELDAFPLLVELEHTGDKLWFYGGRQDMELLDRVLDALPGLTVVLNHLGYWPSALSADEYMRPHFDGAYTTEGLALVTRLARHPRVYVLFAGLYAFARSPWPYDDLRPVTQAIMDAYGPKRMLAGSDYPWIRDHPGYETTLATVEAHFPDLDDAARARVRGENALELFDF